ncbi:MAG: dTDP-4-dehydrorhamnose 3,5-epimerase [Candidatus Kapaibacterium sp.]
MNGLKVFAPKVFRDERGFFMESYRKIDLENAGIAYDFPQDNHSKSSKGVLRGLHFQWSPPQGKLIRVTAGSAFVVELDIRKNSPFFGRHIFIELSEENNKILWVPPGFANGFCALTDNCQMQYKCTSYWSKEGEAAIRFDDPDTAVNWPFKNPIVSDKDRQALTLKEWAAKPESESFNSFYPSK